MTFHQNVRRLTVGLGRQLASLDILGLGGYWWVPGLHLRDWETVAGVCDWSTLVLRLEEWSAILARSLCWVVHSWWVGSVASHYLP